MQRADFDFEAEAEAFLKPGGTFAALRAIVGTAPGIDRFRSVPDSDSVAPLGPRGGDSPMAADPKPTRKKRRRSQREPDVYYVVAIDGWDWSYSLSLNTDRKAVDPYHDRHLQVRGRLLHPKGLRTDRIALTFLPSEDLEAESGRRCGRFSSDPSTATATRSLVCSRCQRTRCRRSCR